MAGGFAVDAVVVMPMWKRTSITFIQLLMTLITAGVIIGYGQLYPMLVDTGVYHHLCGNTPTSNVCAPQEKALDQLFNVGASVSIFVQAPSGVILDFLGPRITCWIGLLLFIPGCFLFAFAPTIDTIDAYMFGFQLLAAGGPFVFISSLPVAQLWPDKQAMILMMTNGVYGGGAFVFFLFSELYNHAHVSMKDLFIGYGVLGCLIVVVAGIVWPKRSFVQTTKTNSIQDPEAELSVLEIITKSLRDMRTIPFIYLATTIVFLVFKSNFFLGTSDQQFSANIPSHHQQDTYNSIFGVVLPGIGMLAGPIGIIFDKFGENVALIILIVLSTISSVCGMIVNVPTHVFGPIQIFRMFVFSAYYPMIYGVWAFFIASKFGNKNFGFLYGVIAMLAGVLNISSSGAFVSYALGSPSFFRPNLILASIGAVFIVYPVVCLISERIRRRSHGSGYYSPIS